MQAEEFYQDDVTYILLPDNESLSASSCEGNLKGNMKGEMQALLKAWCTSCSVPWPSRFCNYLHQGRVDPWVIQMVIPENVFENNIVQTEDVVFNNKYVNLYVHIYM